MFCTASQGIASNKKPFERHGIGKRSTPWQNDGAQAEREIFVAICFCKRLSCPRACMLFILVPHVDSSIYCKRMGAHLVPIPLYQLHSTPPAYVIFVAYVCRLRCCSRRRCLPLPSTQITIYPTAPNDNLTCKAERARGLNKNVNKNYNTPTMKCTAVPVAIFSCRQRMTPLSGAGAGG